MLNLNLTDNVNKDLRQLVMELNRTHVSRFPILVENREDEPNILKFVDSRFPSKAYLPTSAIALLSYEKKFVLECEKIINDKYRTSHDLYHTKATADAKKMLKLLKQYIKPYTMRDISVRTHYGFKTATDRWTSEPNGLFYNLASSLPTTDLVKEIMHLKTAGVEFHTDKFRQLANEGLDLYNEAKRRKSLPVETKHVFFNPDDSIEVSKPYDPKIPNFGESYPVFDSLPDSMQQAIAMLRMVDDGVFVPEVGQRISNREFWVLKQK